MKLVLSLFSGIGGLCHRRQFDILCGGFPCSSTSNTGDKKGLNDPGLDCGRN
ncbi:MAG: DNA cytosine methyltransferase [Nostoc sp.]|uniref:DNA cytosine methyltransferase n=1 Tax=Nostoc sp. TaxID=1180 RepID=UPI002FF8BD98